VSAADTQTDVIRKVLAEVDAAWTIRQVADRQTQLYHVAEDREALREVEDLYWVVDICRTRQDQNVMGTARFHVGAGWGASDVRRSLHRAFEGAASGGLNPWDLPAPGRTYPAVEVCDLSEVEDSRRTLEAGADEILEAVSREEGVTPSHFELVLHDTQTRLVNVSGLDLAGRTSTVVVHMVLVASAQSRSFDIKQEFYRRRLADCRLGPTVEEASRFARHTLEAGLPESGTVPVVMSHSGLDFLFAPILAHAGGEFHLDGLSRFTRGASILETPARGDRFTITSDGLLPMGVETRPFTDQGLPPARVPVLKENVFENVLATAEFAAAIGIEPLGPFTNLVIAPGSTSFDDLRDGERVLWVVEFSAILPDKVTGDFTGEIRLGYDIRNGQARPVKGGAVSGNLFGAMERMTLTKETVFRGNYLGPAALRFEDLTVTG